MVETRRGPYKSHKTRRMAVLPLAVLAVVASPAAAHAGAVVGNGGSRDFSICRNAASERECASGIGLLRQGQNSSSKYGWDDTDMIRIPAGCDLQRKVAMSPDYVSRWHLWATATSHRWFKVTNNAGGPYRVVC